jgi:hypothetical protein
MPFSWIYTTVSVARPARRGNNGRKEKHIKISPKKTPITPESTILNTKLESNIRPTPDKRLKVAMQT